MWVWSSWEALFNDATNEGSSYSLVFNVWNGFHDSLNHDSLLIELQSLEVELGSLWEKESLKASQPSILQSNAQEGVQVLGGDHEAILSREERQSLIVLDLKEDGEDHWSEGEFSLVLESYNDIEVSQGLSEFELFY